MAIISIRDLVVEYDGRRVLDGLNLDVEQGETMVLLGGAALERARSCVRSSGSGSPNPAV
jgi:spermidine/putrescine transport system ATP-binding protein